MKNIGGVYGWRVCHCLVGYLWLAVAAPIFFWMKKPNGSDGDNGGGGGSNDSFKEIRCIMQKTTFWLMVCVGYTSQAAFAVFVYLTMYLQSSGVPGMSIGFAFSVVMIGNLAGGFSGGFMTDHIHGLNKCYGKLSVGAVTVFIRVLAVLAFLWSPIPGGTFRWYHHIYLFVYGITFFTIKAVDISISADLAPGSLKSLTIGLVSAIGGVASNASVVPAVGYLCEKKFGYVTSTEGGGTLPPEVMANNVSALRKSMLIVFVVCSIINIALYLVALATYKQDKDKKDNKACPATAVPAASGGSSTQCGNSTSSENDQPKVSYSPWAKVLYHVYPAMDAIDMEILPICMRAFEVSFGCSPATLSVVGAAEQGALLLMSPLWGYLLGIKKPYQVESAAMLVCGMMCILLGTTTNYRMLVLATLIHGAVLGCTGPSHHKIITSSVKKSERDKWYGIYTGVYYLGAMVSSILASRLSLRNVLGQYGWRLYYCVVGYMWLAAAVPTYYGMRPQNGGSGSPGKEQTNGENNGSFWKGIKGLFDKRSYYFMISLIYVSESCELFMGYIVIYLQYCGVRNQMAGFAISVVHMGNMVAGFIGGYAIQKIHCASKDYGKQLTGIGIIAIRLFAITLLLRKPFQGGNMRWYHYMCLALFGFAQLNRTSIDRTMLSDFVDEKNSAIALSLCRVIAGIPSNFTFPPLIGYLAERAFGYITTDALVEDMDAFTKVTNATALSKSLLYIMGGSCVANMALYGGMMFTYRKDVVAKEAKECKEAVTRSTTIATGTSVYHSVSNSTVTAITCASAAANAGSSDIGAVACAGISVPLSALNDKGTTTSGCARAGIATTSESGDNTAIGVTSCVGLSKGSGSIGIVTDSSATVLSTSRAGSKESTRVVVQESSVGAITIAIPSSGEGKTVSAASGASGGDDGGNGASEAQAQAAAAVPSSGGGSAGSEVGSPSGGKPGASPASTTATTPTVAAQIAPAPNGNSTSQAESKTEEVGGTDGEKAGSEGRSTEGGAVGGSGTAQTQESKELSPENKGGYKVIFEKVNGLAAKAYRSLGEWNRVLYCRTEGEDLHCV
ncbi:multiplied multi-transmembrane transporter-like protein [Babesia gibsoni]|uniref:Multiplied multi-transmembrane transporter-like protein n=1 Tax=Babesia gibsoni TaxID=33632 RepID=A0AAD8PGQ8_BABGI|nr:multiplied multi-transmembrane transporter-like protein [Babesia gibsoni]